jgi:hypothetical protein
MAGFAGSLACLIRQNHGEKFGNRSSASATTPNPPVLSPELTNVGRGGAHAALPGVAGDGIDVAHTTRPIEEVREHHGVEVLKIGEIKHRGCRLC